MNLYKMLEIGKGLPPDSLYDMLIAKKISAAQRYVLETTSGYPCVIENAIGKPLKDYTISGNTIQNGTPTPENPIEVQSVGDKTKNLFDDSESKSGAINDSGTITEHISYSTTGYIGIQEMNDYTFSLISSFTASYRLITFAFYDVNHTFISLKKSHAFKEGFQSYIFQTPKNTSYIRITYIKPLNGLCEDSNIQLELGSEATAYEPYGYKIPVVVSAENHEPITTSIYLNEPLRKIGDYADVIDFERGVVERKIKKIVFDGSDDEQWFYYTQPGVSQKYIITAIDGGSTVLSDKLKSISVNQRPNEYDSIYSGGTPPCIAINLEIPNSSVEWRNWLSENPITAYYVLAKPTTETLILPKIPTFDGTTVITTDTEIQPSNVEVTYKAKRR